MYRNFEHNDYYEGRIMEKKYWTKKDGTKIAINDMDTGHLKNSIALLEKSAESMRISESFKASHAASFFNGEYAQDACESEANSLMDMTDGNFLSLYTPYDDLCKELYSREQ